MAAYWYTYSFDNDSDELEAELDEIYKAEQEEELSLNNYADYLDNEKDCFYHDIESVFVKFYYIRPSRHEEDHWCEPNFVLVDEMGLFYKFVDEETFACLKTLFGIKSSYYKPRGTFYMSKDDLKTLFDFAHRWCVIHVLYYDNDDDFNYKLTLWVGACMLQFLSN